MLAYGAKLVRDNYISGPDLLAFIIYQLTLGGILSVSIGDGSSKGFTFMFVFQIGYFSDLFIIDDSCWIESICF